MIRTTICMYFWRRVALFHHDSYIGYNGENPTVLRCVRSDDVMLHLLISVNVVEVGICFVRSAVGVDISFSISIP